MATSLKKIIQIEFERFTTELSFISSHKHLLSVSFSVFLK